MLGTFIFFDRMGPTEFALGTGINVDLIRISALSTVTYLFEGEIVHRSTKTLKGAKRNACNE